MKATTLIKYLQSQVDLYGDGEVEVTSLTDPKLPHASIHAVNSNIYGTIEISIK